MRILLVSFFFPPYNAIGAVRSGKTAKYLLALGHDVRVISAADQPLAGTLPVEVPEERVLRTRWLNVNRPVEMLLGGRQRIAAHGYIAPVSGRPLLTSALRSLGAAYRTLLHLPDGEIGWYPFARTAGTRLIRAWRPDVILASGRPFTSLLVAHSLAHRFGIPWVAELRDLWTDNHSRLQPYPRRALERRVEARVLSSAARLITVSEPLAERLRGRVGDRVSVVTNGFDPDDYPRLATGGDPDRTGPLRLVYTGMVYAGKQDAGPLFRALHGLGVGVEAHFYGRYLDTVKSQAAEHGVGHAVHVHPPVPYAESLRLQRLADVLLLLLWNDRAERGVYTAKLFEYIGARRPILAVGGTRDAATELIEARGAGVVAGDAEAIRGLLERWRAQKRLAGGIADLPAEATSSLSRMEKTREIENVLRLVAMGGVAER